MMTTALITLGGTALFLIGAVLALVFPEKNAGRSRKRD